ncbi:hypothetical protein LSH36_206g00017 [Paralvinella palmiformis]|uniref:Small acidic protein-like domain-containing protein n=1 Tax=Paralvinella palmiformis TaxID=53620 RepID=A0AAD9N4E4_9ANNE|nr:hypothetical protein LSH36_206g00017 [Paralvinella palmiformis]
MDKLAGYSSDTESEQFDKTSPFRAKPEHSSDTIKGNIDLAAEWESFEKLIAGDDDQEKEKYFVPEPIGVPAPVAAPSIILKQDELYCVENGQKEKSELESEISKASTSDEHKRKRSLPTDSSESGSELESDDSSDDSEESSEESSASDEPDRKKPRHNKTHESSSSEDESEEETSEDGSEDSDTTSPDEDKQKKSSTDEENVPSRTKDNTKKRSVSISRKHDRSRTRKHHRQHSSHRSHRSRSHDRRHRSRSRTRPHHHRRSRSTDKRKRSSRHHSGSRSRDRHPPRPRRHSRDRHQRRRSPPHTKPLRRKPLTYKEVLRQKLIEAQHQAAEGKLEFDPSRGKDLMSTNEKPSPLPLMSINPLMSLATGPPGGEKAQELTGVAVPKYYNPAAVNPLKFAEQVKKRKLLWSKKDSKAEAEAAAAAHQAALAKAAEEGQQSGSKSGSSQWKSTAFLEDKDGRMAAKFRKLMGIKDAESSGTNPDEGTEETIKKQQELFNQLDREYQFARMTTHTHRGIGLGFTSQMYPDLK